MIEQSQQTDRRQQTLKTSGVDLSFLLSKCWSRKWFVAIFSVFCAAIGLILALVLPKEYTATVLLSPQTGQQGSMGGARALLSRYAGLAGMAGLSISANKERAERIALLKSRVVIGQFIDEEHLLPVLFDSKWNSKTNQWKAGVRKPTLYKGIRFFQKHVLTVVDESATGLVQVRVEWKSARLATVWANGLVGQVNSYMRAKEIERAKRHVAFLNSQAKIEHYVSEQQAISQLMENELGREMLATGSNEYAFRVLDPAMIPEKPTFPKRALMIILGFMVGGAISAGYSLIQARRRSQA
jgi:LPS O-antigen subunit length determinant protein (WzzB/FepE family)